PAVGRPFAAVGRRAGPAAALGHRRFEPRSGVVQGAALLARDVAQGHASRPPLPCPSAYSPRAGPRPTSTERAQVPAYTQLNGLHARKIGARETDRPGEGRPFLFPEARPPGMLGVRTGTASRITRRSLPAWVEEGSS